MASKLEIQRHEYGAVITVTASGEQVNIIGQYGESDLFLACRNLRVVPHYASPADCFDVYAEDLTVSAAPERARCSVCHRASHRPEDPNTSGHPFTP